MWPPLQIAVVVSFLAVVVLARRRESRREEEASSLPPLLGDHTVPVLPIETISGWLSGVQVRVLTFRGAAEAGPDLICVHGANSCGLVTWRKLLAHAPIVSAFRHIVVLDLPGFGGSTLGDIPSASEDIQAAFAALISDFMVRPSIVIAHSMGCVLTSSLADHPLFRGAVWVCPIGATPTLGATGAWWSLLFEYAFPHLQLHALGPVFGRALLWCLGAGVLRDYGSLTEPTATGFRVPQRFVGKTPLGRHFAHPWLYRLVRKLQSVPTRPIVLVSGALDSLVPPHIGEMTHATLMRYCPEHVGRTITVPRAGHSLKDYAPEILDKALRWVLRNQPDPEQHAVSPARSLAFPPSPRDFPPVGFMTTFSPRRTQEVIASLYGEMLLRATGEASEAGILDARSEAASRC